MRKSLPYNLLSSLLGVNFFFHGLVRLLGNYQGFVSYVLKGFEGTLIPAALALPLAYVIPPLELFLGLGLFIQLRPKIFISATTGLLAVLIAGMCFQQKWDVVGSQMIYVICLYLLASEYEKVEKIGASN